MFPYNAKDLHASDLGFSLYDQQHALEPVGFDDPYVVIGLYLKNNLNQEQFISELQRETYSSFLHLTSEDLVGNIETAINLYVSPLSDLLKNSITGCVIKTHIALGYLLLVQCDEDAFSYVMLEEYGISEQDSRSLRKQLLKNFNISVKKYPNMII